MNRRYLTASMARSVGLRYLRAAGLCTAAVACVLGANPAFAQFYIGRSYILVQDAPGDGKEPAYRDWIRAEARYWSERPRLPEIRGVRDRKNDLLFTGTTAPASGPDVLNLSVDKKSRGLAALMAKCRTGERIGEVRYAESSETARHPQEHGKRPEGVPAYYEFILKDVTLSCPVVEAAPEQAILMRFASIQWLNSNPQPEPIPISAAPARLTPAASTGTTLNFAVNWFAAAVDSKPDQCERMNTKPSAEDYFALMPADKAARIRASLSEAGVGPDRMPYRGPDELDVGLLPGIVPDPGHYSPNTNIAPGLNLDGDFGTGNPPLGVRKHTNFTSPDGRKGIDNQLFTVEGCVEGLRRNGFLPMIFNEGRAAGRPTILLQISGIDDPRSDDEVWVTLLFSTDELKRSPSKLALPDFTYRVTSSPEYAQDFLRVRGRITDGVITIEPTDQFHIHEVTGIETTIFHPQMRLQITEDGKLKGIIGGYIDWRKRLIFEIFRSSDYENTVGFQIPAIYNAMKRAADGLQNPHTGEFDGISAAFDIEGVPGFLPPEQQALLAAGSQPAPNASP